MKLRSQCSTPRSVLFFLVLACLIPLGSVRGQDVVGLSLYRAGFFEQTGDAPPHPIPETPDESPFFFLSVMEMSGDFLSDPDNLLFVRGVTLQPPTGSLRAMDFLDGFGGFVTYESFSTEPGLTNTFRAGNYTFTYGSVISGDSEYVIFQPDGTLPPPAQILNFAAAQSIDPAQNATLQWTPESPSFGAARLEIYDETSGAQVYDSGAIPGARTSLSIPAGTLQAGGAYRAEVTFTRIDVRDGANSPERTSGSVSTTRFPVKASSGVVPAPQITGVAMNDADEVVLTIQCTPGVPMTIRSSSSLGGSGTVLRELTPDSSSQVVAIPATQLGTTAFLQASQ